MQLKMGVASMKCRQVLRMLHLPADMIESLECHQNRIDHDYADVLNASELSEYKEAAGCEKDQLP